ncbi:hypothetical protein PI125_g11610 [Phytophthora idaei]|nr:hypothetical protein PI125_g11610 [Phytophthora idaei]
MNSREYEDPDAKFGDTVSEILRSEAEEEEEAAIQQVIPPATSLYRTATPDSTAASLEAIKSGDESSCTGESDSTGVMTRTGLSTLRNAVQQALNSASGGKYGGQNTGATTTTGTRWLVLQLPSAFSV